MSRYTPSRHYLAIGVGAFVLAVVSGWFAFRWTPSIIPTVLFILTGAGCILLYLRPTIEIHAHHLRIGGSIVPWVDLHAVDRTGWISPLVLLLTLSDGSRRVLIYPGDLDGCNRLLRQVRRCAREALIDGLPYHEYWADDSPVGGPPGLLESAASGQLPLARYPILREEDEAEVERLYQRLKAVGHLDSKDEN